MSFRANSTRERTRTENVNTRSPSDKTALHKVKSVAAVGMLVDAGADLLARNEKGELPSEAVTSDAARSRLLGLESDAVLSR